MNCKVTLRADEQIVGPFSKLPPIRIEAIHADLPDFPDVFLLQSIQEAHFVIFGLHYSSYVTRLFVRTTRGWLQI